MITIIMIVFISCRSSGRIFIMAECKFYPQFSCIEFFTHIKCKNCQPKGYDILSHYLQMTRIAIFSKCIRQCRINTTQHPSYWDSNNCFHTHTNVQLSVLSFLFEYLHFMTKYKCSSIKNASQNIIQQNPSTPFAIFQR